MFTHLPGVRARGPLDTNAALRPILKAEKAGRARASIGRVQEALQALSGVRAANMRSLVRQIESADIHYEPKGPDYVHIDRLSAEDKRRIAAESEQEYRQDRLHHKFRRAAFIAAAVAVALAAALLPVMYLSSWFNGQPSYTWSESFGKLLVEERIELPIVSVLDNDGEGTLTLYLMRDEADPSNGDRALLRDIYTVQARLDGQVMDLLPSLSAAGRNLFDRGSKFPEECEPVLVLRATAWDFIRLGLNPFSSLRSFYSSAVNALLIKLCALPPYLQGGALTIEVPGIEQYIR